jgi:hypothetical protein
MMAIVDAFPGVESPFWKFDRRLEPKYVVCKWYAYAARGLCRD